MALIVRFRNQIAKSLESRVLLPKAKQAFSELLETNQVVWSFIDDWFSAGRGCMIV